MEKFPERRVFDKFNQVLGVAILDFSKGVNPWFLGKIVKSFIDRFFSRSSIENFFAILKSAKNVEKALFKTVDFGCGHIGFFQRG